MAMFTEILVTDHHKVISNLLEAYFGVDSEINFLELGVNAGATPNFLLPLFPKLKYTGVDISEKPRFNVPEDRITFYQENTNDAFKHMENNSFDFIYIDAWHSLEACLNDIINYLPKAKKKSIFAGHDCHQWDTPDSGVREAVEKIFGVVNYSATSTWWIAKYDLVVCGSRDTYFLPESCRAY
jgi:SAM-dependent methyltransferase